LTGRNREDSVTPEFVDGQLARSTIKSRCFLSAPPFASGSVPSPKLRGTRYGDTPTALSEVLRAEYTLAGVHQRDESHERVPVRGVRARVAGTGHPVPASARDRFVAPAIRPPSGRAASRRRVRRARRPRAAERRTPQRLDQRRDVTASSTAGLDVRTPYRPPCQAAAPPSCDTSIHQGQVRGGRRDSDKCGGVAVHPLRGGCAFRTPGTCRVALAESRPPNLKRRDCARTRSVTVTIGDRASI